MNYRHAYHAGNFADVMKHAILALAIEHLKLKPAPFRVIDTHAGAGHTAIGGDAANRTGEWRDGIGRLLSDSLPPDAAAILQPYLSAIRAANGGSGDRCAELSIYPGSPQIARSLLRRGDSLVANELHPADHAELARHFAGDPQSKVLGLDGWTALRSLLPPRERRGIVLVDPPFEAPGEFHRLVDGLRDAARRFETGIYLLWYPVKDHKRTRSFLSRLTELGLPKLAVAELLIRKPVNPDLFNGCGLVIVNPPYLLGEKLDGLMPFLADRLAAGPGASGSYDWLGTDLAGG